MPRSTPMHPKSILNLHDYNKKVYETIYRGMIGSLLYLTTSRLNIIYLKGTTTNLGLFFKQSHEYKLVGYYDANYVRDGIERKSTSGGCHFIGVNLSTSLLLVVAHNCYRSSINLDYNTFKSNIPLLYNNTTAINLSKNLILHYRVYERFFSLPIVVQNYYSQSYKQQTFGKNNITHMRMDNIQLNASMIAKRVVKDVKPLQMEIEPSIERASTGQVSKRKEWPFLFLQHHDPKTFVLRLDYPLPTYEYEPLSTSSYPHLATYTSLSNAPIPPSQLSNQYDPLDLKFNPLDVATEGFFPSIEDHLISKMIYANSKLKDQ
ncbi:hypothetical protein CR513_47346, partial [Mucuna pruriens]